MSMKEVEATIADLSCNWFIGSETDPRYSRRTYEAENRRQKGRSRKREAAILLDFGPKWFIDSEADPKYCRRPGA